MMKHFNFLPVLLLFWLSLTACVPATEDSKPPTLTLIATHTRVPPSNPTTTEIVAKSTNTSTPILPTKTPRQLPTTSPTPSVTRTPRATSTLIPTPTDVPLIPLESLTQASLPFPWPLSVPTDAQVAEVRSCSIESLVTERYPSRLDFADLPGTYTLNTACDWAVLAVAYAERSNDSPHPDGVRAFAQTIMLNPAFALTLPVLIPYSVVEDTVTAPPFSEQSLVEALLVYRWDGLGDTVSFDVTLTATAEGAAASGTLNNTPFSGTLSSDNWYALNTNLGDLFPIAQPVNMVVCFDNYPEWDVTLTYSDGTQVDLTTNGSNVFNAGGPWQATIEGQRYIQYSPDFLVALLDVLTELELPLGEPMAMYCGGFEEDPINTLFP